MCVNKLILGDNLEILKTLDSESVDLVYLDPPFFSNRNYEVIWGDEGEIRSFQDRWAGGINHYIGWLKERVEEMHRVLKKTGSMFLHCDGHADAYIRVQILDRIFGERNFRNHVIWCYKSRPQSKKYFGRKHDSIFFYSKTAKYNFNWQDVVRSLSDITVGKYRLKDESGRQYRLQGRGITGSPIRSAKDVDAKWEITNPELVVRDYLDEKIGVALEDWWDDIELVNQNSNERIGYPTQKPEALMERIIKAVTNEGDIVLDPFVGGGTTVAVADKLRRKWIGIDQSSMAIKVTDFRLQKQTDIFSGSYSLHLHKYDYDTLRYKDAFEFESWIIEQFGGIPQSRKGGDMGIDGKTADGIPIQVKRSDSISRDVIDKFPTAIRRYDKDLFLKNQKAKRAVGYVIAFSFSKGAIEEAARLKSADNIIIELVKVEDIVPMSFKPSLAVTINELDQDAKGDRRVEFIAKGESGAGIEFYSWDFAYDEKQGFKPSAIFDKVGQQILPLKTGAHNIAVKAVDNDGLESMEIVELKINGGVSRS